MHLWCPRTLGWQRLHCGGWRNARQMQPCYSVIHSVIHPWDSHLMRKWCPSADFTDFKARNFDAGASRWFSEIRPSVLESRHRGASCAHKTPSMKMFAFRLARNCLHSSSNLLIQRLPGTIVLIFDCLRHSYVLFAYIGRCYQKHSMWDHSSTERPLLPRMCTKQKRRHEKTR